MSIDIVSVYILQITQEIVESGVMLKDNTYNYMKSLSSYIQLGIGWKSGCFHVIQPEEQGRII